MEGCDICGANRRTRVVVLEGAEVNACFGCVPKGAAKRPERKKVQRKPSKVKEKVLVEGYNAIVKKAIVERGWDLKTAARELGISESYLRHIEKGDLKPDEKTIKKLERGLNISLLEEHTIDVEEVKSEKKKEFTLEEQAVWE